jgi:PST family polysaccharide transporter
MRKIFASITQLAGMQMVIALTGIVRNKVLALRLGPENFGEFTQIVITVGMVYTLSSFGMGVGLSRNVAAANSFDERQKYLAAANFLVILLGFVSCIILGCIIFTGKASYLFPFRMTARSLWVVGLLAILAPIEVLKNNYLAFLQGLLDIKGLSSRRSVAIILGTVISLPVVWYFGIVGAATQIILMTLFVTYLLGRRCYQLGFHPLKVHYDKQLIILLGSFGIASLLAGFAQNFSDVAIRTALINQLGAVENGYYQAAMVLSQNVKSIIMGSVGSYSMAVVAQQYDRESMADAIGKLLTVILPIAAIGIGLLGTLCYPAVSMLYSSSFLNAKCYFPFLLSGDFIEVFIWVVGAPLLALGYKKLWLTLGIAYSSMLWIFAKFLLPYYGGQAVVMGYVIALIIYLIVILYIFYEIFKLTIDKCHLKSFCVGLIVVFILSYLGSISNNEKYYPVVIAGLVWLGYTVYIVRANLSKLKLMQLFNNRN